MQSCSVDETQINLEAPPSKSHSQPFIQNNFATRSSHLLFPSWFCRTEPSWFCGTEPSSALSDDFPVFI